MAENINLDVAGVLTVFSNLKDKNPEAAKRTEEVLRLILGKEGFMPGDVAEALAPMTAAIKALTDKYQQTQNQIGELMATFQEVKAGIEANTAQAAKSQIEIRAKMDELLAKAANTDAAVAAALAADAVTDEADFTAKMDELKAAVDAQKAATQALDDVVPDVVVPPPVDPPVEPPPVVP